VEGFDGDRYLVDRLVRPAGDLYRITPVATGETPAAPPAAYVSRTKPADGDDIRFYADEQETEDVFQIKAQNVLDLGGSRYDVYAGERQIGALEHQYRRSRVRSTWRIRDASNQEIAVARERSLPMAVVRHLLGLLPGTSSVSAMSSNFDLLIDGRTVGTMDGKLPLRDRYVLDVSGDRERQLDRRLPIALAIELDALQSR
jgi:hypothetical protein